MQKFLAFTGINWNLYPINLSKNYKKSNGGSVEKIQICNGSIYLDFSYNESKIHSDKTRSFILGRNEH